jgi:hypothetical protein
MKHAKKVGVEEEQHDESHMSYTEKNSYLTGQ